MRACGLMIMALVVWCGTSLRGLSQEDLILMPGDEGSKVTIKGEVKCAHPASGTVKKSCPTISASDAEACPTGSCFTGEHSGCLYYPPVNGTPKSRYLIQKNNSAEYDYPVRTATGIAGKETREKPNSRVICFEAYQCRCKRQTDGSGICKSEKLYDVAIVEYEVTDKNCFGGVVNTEVPE